MLDRGDLIGATQKFKTSIELKRQALALHPQDLNLRSQLADSLSWQGQTLALQGEFKSAREHFAMGLQEIETVRRQTPHDLSWIFFEAFIRNLLGKSLWQAQHPEQALAEYRQAQTLTQELLRQEPKNRLWRTQWVRANLALAEAARSPQTIPQLQELLASVIAQSQGASATTAARRLPLRAQISLALAHNLQAQHRESEAMDLLTPLSQDLRKAIDSSPDDLLLHTESAHVRLALSALYRQQKQPVPAQAQCAVLLEELQGLRRFVQLHFEITQAWTQAQSCLGREDTVAAERAWLNRHAPT